MRKHFVINNLDATATWYLDSRYSTCRYLEINSLPDSDEDIQEDYSKLPDLWELADILGFTTPMWRKRVFRHIEDTMCTFPPCTNLMLVLTTVYGGEKRWITPSRRRNETLRGYKSRLRTWLYKFVIDEFVDRWEDTYLQ